MQLCTINKFFSFSERIDSDLSSASSIDFDLTLKTDKLKPIFNGSLLTNTEFALLFILLCDKINICKSSRDTLLKFIKAVMPKENILDTSYHMMEKRFQDDTRKSTDAICSICLNSFDKKIKRCVNTRCQRNEILRGTTLTKKTHFEVSLFNVCEQIRIIFNKNYEEIKHY